MKPEQYTIDIMVKKIPADNTSLIAASNIRITDKMSQLLSDEVIKEKLFQEFKKVRDMDVRI